MQFFGNRIFSRFNYRVLYRTITINVKVFHIQQGGGEEKAAIISVHSNSIHARTKPRASFSFLFSRGEFLELPFIVALIIILKRITRVLDFGA